MENINPVKRTVTDTVTAKIINGIAEKYNGILSVQVRGGFFAVTTTLCLDENNE